MKLGRCEAWNFGSYSHLELDLANVGLGLIYGKTGSGKSTIPDIPCWAMFGVTAKNGSADDVRSWQTPNEPTKVVLDVETQEGSITITRIRGKAGQNDLYWTENMEMSVQTQQRGKDLSETQKRLSARLGCDAALYLSASYFCDFSPSGSFFTAKAKDRRELFEKIACLDFPVKLAERLSEAKKASKKDLDKTELQLSGISGKLEQLEDSKKDLLIRHQSWGASKAKREATAKASVQKAREALWAAQDNKETSFIEEELKELSTQKPVLKKIQTQYNQHNQVLHTLITERQKLDNVPEMCPTCLTPQASNCARKERISEITRLIKIESSDAVLCEAQIDRLESVLDKEPKLQADLRNLENIKARQALSLVQAEKDYAALDEENPFEEALSRLNSELESATKTKTSLDAQNRLIERRVSSLGLLYDLSFNLRGELLKKAVADIEISTNGYLERYFDAEIRVSFSANDADNLDVIIQKSGFQCSYKQLSRGQRQLLKLCFAVSIMGAAANSAGVNFSNLWFDESLDGLDDELKVKAFTLFSELETEHESVVLIDHAPAFQNLFSKRYQVIMDSDTSTVELEYE